MIRSLRMMLLAMLASLLFACGSKTASQGSQVSGSQQPPPVDPWAQPVQQLSAPGAEPELPTLAQNHQRAEQICPKVQRAHLFKVSKNGTVNHLLGTRHVSIGADKLPASVQTVIRDANKLVFEVDPNDTMTLPDPESKPLHELLDANTFAHFRKLVGDDRAESLDRRGVVAASLALVLLFEDLTQSLDLELQQQALSTGKQTGGLETSRFQQELLGKLLDVRSLKTAIIGAQHRGELLEASDREIKSYCSGVDRAPGIDAADRKEMISLGYAAAEIDKIEDLMLFARNRDWIPKLEQLFVASDSVVVVGVDHLRGDKGVIKLLRDRGFAVERIEK